jgi:hypothetical protein
MIIQFYFFLLAQNIDFSVKDFQKNNHSPRMKVFTVGLDQKPPLKDATDPSAAPEKSKDAGGSPPPGYATATKTTRVPLPMGPEIPLPPQPIVMRKSRGYKGILMVMLAVFLMALFALTLSEIAYNRQRDENFFRLRWAELKHRLGYGDVTPFDYYHHRASAAALNNPESRFFSLGRNKELSEAFLQQQQQSEPTSTSTTTPPQSSTSELPVVAIDSFPRRPQPVFEPEMDGGAGGPSGMIRDARLQFLKTILQKIKQHAEDMGFDGTMQVSVIEVEPQGEEASSPFGSQFQHSGPKPHSQFHPFLPHFFPHFPVEDNQQQQQQKQMPDSFLDGFGEFHQPSFMQNNQVVEQNRARTAGGPFGGSGWPHDDDSQQQQQHGFGGPESTGPHWPRPNANPFRPEQNSLFFPNWPQQPQQPQQLQQAFPQFPQAPQQAFPQALPPHILPRPPSFDRWSQPANSNANNNNNLVDGGDDISSSSQQQQQQAPMIQLFPQPPPAMQMLPPMIPTPNNNNNEHNNNNSPQDQPSAETNPENNNNNGPSPSQEVVGEIYGRKFGQMLQDIIANRIQGFHNLQQVNPLMLPPAALMGASSPPSSPSSSSQQRATNAPDSSSSQLPQMPAQPLPIPQQWWPSQQQQANQQQQIAPADLREEKQENGAPAPPPIIFFPPGQQPQIQNPESRKDEQRELQRLPFPIFNKNFIPPEDRIQVEPPQQNFPMPPHQQQQANNDQQQQLTRHGDALGSSASISSNSDEPLIKSSASVANGGQMVVDQNIPQAQMPGGGQRAWTHQFPRESSAPQSAEQNSAESGAFQQEQQLPQAFPRDRSGSSSIAHSGETRGENSAAQNSREVPATGVVDNEPLILNSHPHPVADADQQSEQEMPSAQPPAMVDDSTDNDPQQSQTQPQQQPGSGSGSGSNEQQQQPPPLPAPQEQPVVFLRNGFPRENNDDEKDEFVTGPPDFSKKKLESTSSSSSAEKSLPATAETPVDFPAVKFPMNGVPQNLPSNKEDTPSTANNDQQPKPVKPLGNTNGPLDMTQNDHHSPQQQPLVSNPVFFQVDDPSASGTTLQDAPPRAILI